MHLKYADRGASQVFHERFHLCQEFKKKKESPPKVDLFLPFLSLLMAIVLSFLVLVYFAF